ncbi:tRNA-specific adenosine deaminase subunit TAD2 [Colletotrichum orchidophilum]|uniref:tRNA-specific adenosine deaminase subunit TAD2 n=1 Tax=Colletotrichum orchidophilum TaxID=1209926 RepID=A0A1G4BPZ3_9PEZI|nr:tRNA-specific adenosine deaminase subunit TAD2 [Colletotrichum orchidophilum]OHF03367.1 tRNA-specific adenosine deaminase subunit TAD2 [Colletotrichum orchidophilum]
MNAPTASDASSGGSGSGPESGSGTQDRDKGKRASSTSKFLQNILCRLKTSLTPNPKSPSPFPSSPTLSPSSKLPSTITAQIQSSRAEQTSMEEDSRMAGVITQHSRPTVPVLPLHSSSKASIPASDHDKENRPSAPVVPIPAAALSRLSLESIGRPRSSASIPQSTLTPPGERPMHQMLMDQALDMARLALRTNETPVGCVLVHNGSVIARGMNATNVTRNGTRHAEFMALSALLSYRPNNSEEAVDAQLRQQASERSKADVPDDESDLFPDDDEYVRKGHLYPYGQKLHPAPRVDRSIVRECTLYVTVEPCVMCAGLLRQLGINEVYFGAVNDKFGGTGGVFSIHKNSTDTRKDPNPVTVLRPLQINASNVPRPVSSASGTSLNINRPASRGGDGGNVEPGFEAEGGWGRDEAVGLLRRFYVQENGRAPVPRKKEGRAARLAAMEQAGGEAGTPVPSEAFDGAAGEDQDVADNDTVAVSSGSDDTDEA